MQFSSHFPYTIFAIAAFNLHAQAPEANAPGRPASVAKPASISENTGIPPRAAPSDYSAEAKVGTVIFAADFDEHGIPTPEGALESEQFVVVELGIFGPPGTRLPVNFSNFGLRINGKKNPVPAESFEHAGASAKDPEWAPAEKPEKPSSTSIGGGGNDTSTAPPRPPAELRRAWAKRVMQAALAEGERPLPRAGLLYFPYSGKGSGIHSLELIYSGAAGKATLKLH